MLLVFSCLLTQHLKRDSSGNKGLNIVMNVRMPLQGSSVNQTFFSIQSKITNCCILKKQTNKQPKSMYSNQNISWSCNQNTRIDVLCA